MNTRRVCASTMILAIIVGIGALANNYLLPVMNLDFGTRYELAGLIAVLAAATLGMSLHATEHELFGDEPFFPILVTGIVGFGIPMYLSNTPGSPLWVYALTTIIDAGIVAYVLGWFGNLFLEEVVDAYVIEII